MSVHFNKLVDYLFFEKEPVVIGDYTIYAIGKIVGVVFIEVETYGKCRLDYALPGYTFDFNRALFIDGDSVIHCTEFTSSSVAQYDGCKEGEIISMYYN